ncbi:hypothetical protein HAX54_038221 [Datura stramonium]|uniref:DEAD/DEAH-box helicase domain-containing protein n=1 Tax=Datura stramonium TaxID=4076 RepID=A0ABS8RMZ4_DATST|nr:hypothetical protein [Datura stramonium]
MPLTMYSRRRGCPAKFIPELPSRLQFNSTTASTANTSRTGNWIDGNLGRSFLLAKKELLSSSLFQRAVLEPAMQGSDMIGRARTGTGKTLAFGIPIMDKIIRFNEKHDVEGILWL